jgi:hypothetical protein
MSRLVVGLTKSPIQWVLVVLSPGLKLLGYAKVKNDWICTFTLSVCLHGMDRDSLFYLPVWDVLFYSFTHIRRTIIGNKPLDVEFVNIHNKHIMVLYQEKYRTSHCIHKNEISLIFVNCCII